MLSRTINILTLRIGLMIKGVQSLNFKNNPEDRLPRIDLKDFYHI